MQKTGNETPYWLPKDLIETVTKRTKAGRLKWRIVGESRKPYSLQYGTEITFDNSRPFVIVAMERRRLRPKNRYWLRTVEPNTGGTSDVVDNESQGALAQLFTLVANKTISGATLF